MNIPIILGTGRDGRFSNKVADFIKNYVISIGHKTEIIDPRNYNFIFTNNESSDRDEYRQKIKQADALIIVSPEYNHGYPGELKILLDTAYEEYFYKPVAICGVSAGPFGGIRAVEQLKLIFSELKMQVASESVFFGNVRGLFNEDIIQDDVYYARVKTMIDELISLTTNK